MGSKFDFARWSTNLENLLDDSEGVELFKYFLTCTYASGHLLDFWFACKGFRSNVDLTNPDKLFQVAKVIYRTYIKTGACHAVPLPTVLKQSINDHISLCHHGYKNKVQDVNGQVLQNPDRCMFDMAQEHIKMILEDKYCEFLNFLKCPKNLLCLFSDTQANDKNQSDLLPLDSSNIIHSVESNECIRSNMLAKWKFSGRCKRHSTDHTADTKSSTDKPDHYINSNLTDTKSPNPISECVDDADNTILSNPDSKHRPMHSNSKTPVSHSITINPIIDQLKPPHTLSTSSPQALISGCHLKSARESSHRVQSGPVKKQTHLAESDPASFVQLLSSKLNKIKESRGKVEKLMSWINHVDEKHFSDSVQSPALETGIHLSHPSYVNNWPYDNKYHINAESKFIESYARPSKIDSNNLHFHKVPVLCKSNSTNLPELDKFDFEQDAQGILDDHCSRIWADDTENHHPHLNVDQSRRKRTSTSQPSSAYSIVSDTLVHSVHTSLAKSFHQENEYGVKRKTDSRRRVAVSAMASFPSSNNCASVFTNYSQRCSGLRSHNKTNRSDARSTASWDSGVVANCYLNDSTQNDGSHEDETSSLLETASLQALSSSTTELALVNGEVTARLVEQMMKHYPHHQRSYLKQVHHQRHAYQHNGQQQQLYSQSRPCVYPINQMVNSNYETVSSHEQNHIHHPNNLCTEASTALQLTTNNEKPNTINTNCPLPNEVAKYNWLTHCTDPQAICANCSNACWNYRALIDRSAAVGCSLRNHSFFNASDTSSTFDSGISSTYDQLPMRIKQATGGRENRSQSFHNWQTSSSMDDSNSSDAPRRRTSSITRTQHNSQSSYQIMSSKHRSNMRSEFPHPWWNVKLPQQQQQHHGHQRQRQQQMLDEKALAFDATTCSYCSTNTDCKSGKISQSVCKKSTSGHLLQHWLQLQDDTNTETIKPCSGGVNSNKCTRDSVGHGHTRVKLHHHHHHHQQQQQQQQPQHERRKSNVQRSDSKCNSLSQQQLEKSDDKLLCSTIETNPTTHTLIAGIVVGYYLCDDPVPYRTVWNGTLPLPPTNSNSTAEVTCNQTPDCNAQSKPGQSSLTLGQFKHLIAKKGVYRYFFKKPSDEFGTGVVHEELTNDDATVPLWDGKVVARVERAE